MFALIGVLLKNNASKVRRFIMPRIISVGTAVPAHEITQNEAKKFAYTLFKDKFKDINRLISIFDHTQIAKRHFCVPMDWFDINHSFEEKNTIYIKNAIELSKKAINNALNNTDLTSEDIDHIIFVSSTGISTPSIDAFLFNEPDLRFNQHIKRSPIWGLGCAGGAVGLSRGFEYTKAFPKQIALVIALEIGELAFQRNDLSKSNLVATSLFGDGAAAVIIVGDEVKKTPQKNELRIISSFSTIWKNSLNVMGWDVKNDGLQVIFSRDIPTIIKNQLKPNIVEFLAKHDLKIADLDFFILHPGGVKVIEAYQEALEIPTEKLKITKEVLYEYGNMSSPTVLFCLKENLDICNCDNKGNGILLALGPGFSSEALLLKKE